MKYVNFVLERLKEPSTYAGLSGVAIAVGISDEMYTAVASLIAGVAGIVSILLAERSK